MQWSNEKNGGFSTAEPEQLRRPVVEGKAYGRPASTSPINVTLLNWMERLIRRRRECPEIGWGRWRVLDSEAKAVLALRYDWEERIVITVHNLSSEPCEVELAPGGAGACAGLVDLFGRGACELRRDGSLRIELEPYGARWPRARRAGDRLQY